MTPTRAAAATIQSVLVSVFPNGTQALGAGSQAPEDAHDPGPWSALPLLPYDVFAFCAHLIDLAGLMGYFEPDPDARPTFGPGVPLQVVLSGTTRSKCVEASEEWRSTGAQPTYAHSLWKVICDSSDLPIRVRDYQNLHRENMKNDPTPAPAPEWWRALFELLIIADETCDGIGHFYQGKTTGAPSLFEDTATARIKESRASETQVAVGSPGMFRARSQPATLAAAADRSVVCVQPKGRVSEVGCTLRNISRNLSITGPVGSVRCSWQQLAGKPRGEIGESLDILLIPLPFELYARNFKSTKVSGGWGNFEVEQTWLQNEKKIRDLVRKLIREALQDVSSINAVVFPEFSLTFELFKKLMDDVDDETEGTVEFMIAGASGNCDEEACNCVLTAIWEDRLAHLGDGIDGKRTRLVSQKKHHRWKLDRGQISNYGLASSLKPDVAWWESHNIGQRELNFFQFRQDAVFASLICEDLARNDPCHEILRSVAPNLVFALLMDGPQLPNRWPARYAGTLADDPGCTVLTLTSAGLVERGNLNSQYQPSNSVGLLRDSYGLTRELVLPTGRAGILLTLGSSTTTDRTIDGRKTNNASSWHFISQRPVGDVELMKVGL